ncbi:hypothetical protein [Nocardia sp. MH4]|uniref:hypothetical protein n=1 Tax=Nocardia sp. MH4 TaxID=1768677 RepID=UPI001C4FB6E8|nr:hypothetical protein [Nocardia sp. MH4]
MTNNVRAARSGDTTPGPIAAFARFVACGGGLGLVSSAAVGQLACVLPWAVANAVVTIVSTLLGTVLHALITFGGRALPGWREHWQSAGSAAAAYAVTSAAMFALFAVQPSPGVSTVQVVYLSASGLAGIGRFLVLRMVVFAGPEPAAPSIAARGPVTNTGAPVEVVGAGRPAAGTQAPVRMRPSTTRLVLPAPRSHRHWMPAAA